MRKIAHISDLHFGAADELVAERLIECVASLDPHLVICSGDLTQRARTTQFAAARAFLDRLPQPQLVIPGNHDVPLYNVYDRFVNPLEKYERIVTDELEPFISDDEVAVARALADDAAHGRTIGAYKAVSSLDGGGMHEVDERPWA